MELTVEYIKKRIGNKYTSEDIDEFELKRKEFLANECVDTSADMKFAFQHLHTSLKIACSSGVISTQELRTFTDFFKEIYRQ